MEQKSPPRTVSFSLPNIEKFEAGRNTAQTNTVVPTPIRVLRSQSRKVVDEKTSPPPPRSGARTRKAAALKPRKGNAAKNDQAAKVAATKVKSKTRRDR